MRFNKVLFTDDFLRTRATGMLSHPINRRMLHGLFAPALARLGVAHEEVFSKDDGGEIPTVMLIEAMLSAETHRKQSESILGLKHWAAATTGEIPSRLASHLDMFQPDALVIGFGLPPSILNFLDRRGCAFIDAEIHPIRFTRNLAFRIRTNDSAIFWHLDAATESDEQCWAAAAALSAYCARRSPPFVIDKSMKVGVFVGQQQVDFSLVQNGTLMSPADRLAEISALAREVDFLLIKPHPYQESASHLWPVYGAVPNAMWCTENIYALMCHDNVEFVTALSSGVLTEAPFFLKAAHPLIRPDRDNPTKLPKGCSPWRRVGANIASIDVLSRILGREPISAGAPLPADAITSAIEARWGAGDPVRAVANIPVVVPGRLYFSRGGDGVVALADGWSQPDKRGVCIDGPTATLRFRLLTAFGPGETLRLHLAGRLLGSARRRARTVRLRLPGRSEPIYAGRFGMIRIRPLRLDIDPRDMPQRSFVEITFEVLDPIPSAMDASSLSHNAGVALSMLRIELRKERHGESRGLRRTIARAWRQVAEMLRWMIGRDQQSSASF